MLAKVTKFGRRYARYYSGKLPLETLVFFVTNRCNFRCEHCFSMEALETDKRPELSLEEIEILSKSLDRLPGLLISGGEPVVRKDLPEICEVFFKNNGLEYIHLPTNAFYPGKVLETASRILSLCPGVELGLGISLDGLKDTHDRVRANKKSFDRAIETLSGLEELKQKYTNFSTHVITVVTRNNVNDIIPLSKFLQAETSVDFHGPSPMRGDPYDNSIEGLSAEEWADLVEQMEPLQRYWIERGSGKRLSKQIQLNRLRYQNRLYSKIIATNELPFVCKAGELIGVLYPSGDFGGCELKPTIGNVREFDLDLNKLWRSDAAKAFRAELPGCACEHACFLGPSINFNPVSLVRSTLIGSP